MRAGRTFAIVTLLLVFAATAAAMTRSQGSPSESNPRFAVTPALQSVEVNPGGSKSVRVSLLNLTARPISLDLTTHNVVASKTPTAFVDPTTDPAGAALWSIAEVENVKVEPGETVGIDVALSPPKNTPPGTYAFALVARRSFTTTNGTSRVKVDTQVNPVVVVNVGGVSATSFSIKLKSSPRLVLHGDRPTFSATLTNNGTTFVLARPKLVVPGFLGNAEQSIKGAPTPALPNGKREIKVRWNEVPWLGVTKPKFRITANKKTQTITLPTIVVLPPVWFDVLFVAAFLLPLVVRLRARSRRTDESHDDDDDV